MTDHALDYIPGLIAAYQAGYAGDHVHLGYWAPGATLDWRSAQDAMTNLHLDALELKDDQTVVDIGCGIGGSLRMADSRTRNSILIGLNIDQRQLVICRTHQPTNGNSLSWMQGDAGQMPLADTSADRILSLEAMFHFPSRLAFLTEATRILRPGGVLVCSDISYDTPPDAQTARWLDVVTRGYAPWPIPVIAPDDVAHMGVEAGLILRQSRDISAEVAPSWRHIVSRRDSPDTSAVAAMRDLQRAGLLRYQLFIFEKPIVG